MWLTRPVPAPPNWREALASLARKRGAALQAFADELEGETLRMTMRDEPIICVLCGQEIELKDIEALAPGGEPHHTGGCPTDGEAGEPDNPEPSHDEEFSPWRKNQIPDAGNSE
jgi:hypothetical protein